MSIKETFNHFKSNKEGLSKMLSLDLGVESLIVGEKISQGTHQGLNWILGGQWLLLSSPTAPTVLSHWSTELYTPNLVEE